MEYDILNNFILKTLNTAKGKIATINLNMPGRVVNTLILPFFGIFLLFSLIIQSPIFAFNKEFTHLTIENGLSQSTIYNIIQDKKGYLWVTTQDGLNRYDGYSFKIFRHTLGDSLSISDNSVAQLLQDKNSDIWISTIHGNINQYHYKKERFSSFHINKLDRSLEDISFSSMELDSSEFIWFATNGLIGKFNISDKSLTFYNQYNNQTPVNSPIIYIDKKYNIWVGDESGLYLFNRQEKQFNLVKKIGNSSLNKDIIAITEDNSGNIWLGISGYAPLKFNPVKDTIDEYNQYFSVDELRKLNEITSILYTSTNEVVIGTLSYGLFIFNTVTHEVENLYNNPIDDKSLSFNHVLCLFEDRAQNLWIGTLKGLNKLDLKPKKFETYRINSALSAIHENDGKLRTPNVILSVFKDSRETIWLGTYTAGLYTIDKKTKKFHRFDEITYQGESVWAINEIGKEKFLLGTNKGLNYIDLKSGRSQYFSIEMNEVEKIYWVRDIVAIGNNQFWIGMLEKGVMLFDFNEKQFISFPLKKGKSKEIFKKDVLSLYRDHAGVLWIGTRLGGLYYYDKNSGALSPFTYSDKRLIKEFNRINSITEDKQNRVWVATENGLVCIKADRKNIVHYSIKDGLLNSYIYSVEVDSQQNIWAASNNGLSKIHMNKYGASLIYNYTMEDGLQSNEFNTNSSYKDDNGNIYFGGIDGLNVFDPLKIVSNPHVPAISFSRIVVNNRLITLQNSEKEIVLEPYYSNLNFMFAALDFTNTANNQYAYKLDGFDKDWVYNGVKNSVRYTGLDPGEYKFYVKGTNNDGLWSNENEFVEIKVLTPVWETAFARIIYLIILIFFVVFMVKARTRKVRRDKENLDRQVKTITGELQENYKKLEETKNELIHSVKMKAVEVLADGMAHDFNNLLFVILNSAQLLKEAVNKPEKKKLVENIEIAATDASVVIKRIQDFSTNNDESSKDKIDINKVLLDAIDLIETKINKIKIVKNIDITIKKDININWITYGNLSEFRLAFTNILINAIESFNKSGNIQITSRFNDNNEGIIEFSDQGKGIDKELLNHIFDPFFTTKGVHGSGLGLSQVYGIVNRHKGRIKAESTLGIGTKIIITLPAEAKKVDITMTHDEKMSTIESISKGGKSILIIEDEAVIRELYDEILSMQGYQLEMAETGEEGVAKWEDSSFDLLICDLGLPGLLNGWDVIAKIRERNNQLPILVITGWGNTIEMEQVEKYHVNKVLTKPVPVPELIKEVARLIDKNVL